MFWLRGHRIVLGLITLGILLVFGLLPVYGDELDKIKKQQKEVQQDIEKQKQKLNKKNKEKKTVLGQLENLELDMKDTKKDINNLEKQLDYAQNRVVEINKELKETEETLDERTEVFKKRLKEVYLNGQVSYLEVLFQSTDVSDFLSRFDLLEKLVDQDVKLMDTIETKKKEVESKKAELVNKRDEISSIKQRTEREKMKLEERTKQKKGLLKTIEQQKVEAAQALDELEALSNKLAKEIRKIQEARKNSVSLGTGKYSWPVPGYTRISSDYGWRIHPILKTKRMHTGTDIPAPAGTNIHAVDSGVVIYSGWYGAYGNTVIVDHGKGISSMYPHQSKILVKENQEVKRNQVIGKVGSTGWSTGPHLHFEIRKNGNPVNPWNYISK